MNRREFLLTSTTAVSLGIFSRGRLWSQTAAPAAAPVTPPPLVTEFKKLRRGVGWFTGRGGTIGWLANEHAVVAVDTQFAEPAQRFIAEMPTRGDRPFDAVINTHHHGDHTSGNATFRPLAKSIVAHEAVPGLQRAAAQRSPQMGEPTVADTTFATTWRMDAGDEKISAQFFGPAHTAGDIAVCFERANIVHVGDLVFNRLYPVTDKAGGCRIRAWITALERLQNTYPADALYIMGHGHSRFGITGSRADVLVMRDFLTALVEHVQAEIAAGKSKAEIVTRQNLDGFPDFYAERNSRLPANLSVVYDELTS